MRGKKGESDGNIHKYTARAHSRCTCTSAMCSWQLENTQYGSQSLINAAKTWSASYHRLLYIIHVYYVYGAIKQWWRRRVTCLAYRVLLVSVRHDDAMVLGPLSDGRRKKTD